MRVGYVFKYSFSAETISPISVILATLLKNGKTFRKLYLFSCRYKNVRDIGVRLKRILTNNVNNFETLRQTFL